MKKKKWNIGFTCSAFDLFHAGHMLMLQQAKKRCKYLIVGLQVNPALDKNTTKQKDGLKFKSDRSHKQKPVCSIIERFIMLKGCRYVDEIIPYETEKDLYDLLRSINIDVKIMGEEYKEKEYTGKDLEGILFDVYYNPRRHDFSTTNLRNKLKNDN